MVEDIGGRVVKKTCRPTRTVDVCNIVLDISLLETRLSSTPQVTLQEGIQGSWEWLLHQP